MTTVVVIIIVVTTVIILVLPPLLLRIVLLLLLLFVFLFLVSATGSKASVRLFRTAGARKGTITTRKHTFIIFIFIIIIIIITITIIIDIITTITTTITILTLIINRPSKQPCPPGRWRFHSSSTRNTAVQLCWADGSTSRSA